MVRKFIKSETKPKKGRMIESDQQQRPDVDKIGWQGAAGELHQTTVDGYIGLTTQQGIPVNDNQNTLKVGASGPALLEDFYFREKIFHFDHERIPERVVHARGYGAHGFFETLKPIPHLTKAHLFQKKGEKTPVFVRFSAVTGSKGSYDLARDVRGFAVKFYTQEGNWDLVGNNIPVFFIQDSIKFPDLIHANKEAPDRSFPQAQTAHDNFWDFISLMPEAMHMVMWIMSDRAIPRSFRFMEGFGVHTFRFINAKGKSTFVKFHWKPKLGVQSVVWNEAVKINGADPDFHRRDLWQSIEAGDFPEWELGIQTFDEEWAQQFDFDVLDPTKLIPEELLPVEIIGRMVLNKMPDNFFAETEQVAFCPQNIVRGIDFSDDPLLQGRTFSYLDTQLKRLGGPNYTHLPINAPKCPFHFFQQDGHMAFYNPKGRVNYEPNGWAPEVAGPREQGEEGFVTYPHSVEGEKTRKRPESFGDHYSQARQFYMSQTDIEKKHIVDALTFELSKCLELPIRERMVAHLLNIDEDLAKQVAENLNLDSLPEPAPVFVSVKRDLPPSDALSILKNLPQTFKGRKVGILMSDGIEENMLKAFEDTCQKNGVVVERIALRVGGVETKEGSKLVAEHQIDGAPSVLFDAVAIFADPQQIAAMENNAAVRDFITDAYAHYKFIAYNEAALELFSKLKLPEDLDEGFCNIENKKGASLFLEKCKDLRFWDRPDGAK